MKRLQYTFARVAVLSSVFFFVACGTPYRLVGVTGSKTEMNSTWNSPPDEALTVLNHYKGKLDSIMLPVVGRSSMDMVPLRPGSSLTNLVADVLRESAQEYLNINADLSIMNIGGIRNTLKEGNITYGDIYEILPFENSLCVVMLRGSAVRELMENVVSVYGEGISNVKMLVSPDKKILECTVGSQSIDDNRLYAVATLDYLAEGNDKLVAFLKAEDKFCLEELTVRQIFLKYVQRQTAEGKEVTADTENRIVFIKQ